MNEQNNHDLNDQQSLVADLTVSEIQAAAVKGGPLGNDGSVRFIRDGVDTSASGGAGKVSMNDFRYTTK